MITNMKFSEILDLLLSALDISINRLSRAINVDSSLVNRWIHGIRIPSYNTPYIESISEYLSKNIYNTFQEQRINELFLNVCEDNEAAGSFKEKIKKVLLESQGYSIECKKNEQNRDIIHSTNKEQISKFLNNDLFHSREQDNIYDEYSIYNTNKLIHSVSLSSEDKIIFGADNVLAASISLLQAAANQKCRNNNTICITYNLDGDIESYPYNGLIHWRNALLEAINSGWNVLLLLKINNDANKAIKFINFAKPLIKTGKFNPYYIKKYDSFAVGEELVIVPEAGAMSCFSANLHSGVNCAFYLKNKTAVDIFRNYFNVFLATCAKPLVKNYYNKNNIDYDYYLTECEENIGNRFLYKYCFSVITLPENLYVKLLKKKNLLNHEMLLAMEFYKRRLNAFLSNIQNYEYKDIYLADSIKDLIKHRQFYFYCHTGVELMDLEVQDIIEHLENIIHLLEIFDNYSIAFMPKNADNTIKNHNFYCVVKERQAVLLEIFNPSKSIPEVRLSIEEPMLVRAFDEYFKEIWDQIAPVNKDKNEVISWLQNQINLLKK